MREHIYFLFTLERMAQDKQLMRNAHSDPDAEKIRFGG